MDFIKIELQVGKEGKELIDCLDKVAEKIMAKAPIAEYSVLLQTAYAAVDGISGLSAEIKAKTRSDMAAYLVKVLLDRVAPVVE